MANERIELSLRSKEMLLHALIFMDGWGITIVPSEYMEYYEINSVNTFKEGLRGLIDAGFLIAGEEKHYYQVKAKHLKKIK